MNKTLKGKFVEVGKAETLEAKFKALGEGKFISIGDSFIKVGLYEGELTEFNKQDQEAKYDIFKVYDFTFTKLDKSLLSYDLVYEWTPESEWYHNIPKEGVPCWVNPNSKYKSIAIITDYNHITGSFISSISSCSYTEAEPVTKETMPKLLEDYN